MQADSHYYSRRCKPVVSLCHGQRWHSHRCHSLTGATIAGAIIVPHIYISYINTEMSSVIWTDAKSIYHIVSLLLFIYSANTISVFHCLYLGPKKPQHIRRSYSILIFSPLAYMHSSTLLPAAILFGSVSDQLLCSAFGMR